ncbi:DUF1287 domain-containing protein [Hyphomicrobium sp.]|uniref:DUF1287 domain-containing protein n=1 Tax=Hyphomicrobium sp. TaxID=82 RepID=UPI0025BC4A0C|nr:DUF1287 domain-containing protein [Hyphomicrobium sp.]MCC7250420.1 DUF1287 domain-containing protein [Hyphomicrobium sp.]
MKKPRKSRPKTKPHRAPKPGPAPRRVYAPAPKPLHLKDLRRAAGRRFASAVASGREHTAHALAELTRLARSVTSVELRPSLRRLRAEARALALPYSNDEREALALLFLPFLLVASAIVTHQSVRVLQSYLTAIAMPEQEIVPIRRMTGDIPPAAILGPALREATSTSATLAAVHAAPKARDVSGPGAALATAPVGPGVAAVATPGFRLPEPEPHALAEVPYDAATEARGETQIALLAPADGILAGIPSAASTGAIETFDADERGKPIRPGICAIDQTPRTPVPSTVASDTGTLGGDAFGLRLAEAAEAQVGAFVIYNDAYRSISYPMGDVHRLYGVCTDVVVRAYRALGLDLQALVHEARAGTGDTNIDQRRTEVLRRFFAREGESLPITTFPEDYRPGDIVTYHRPQNTRSRAHIAIVSSVIAPSGRPMIVHNRGWGPQLEDALFVDEITGHYRYLGPAPDRSKSAGLEIHRVSR